MKKLFFLVMTIGAAFQVIAQDAKPASFLDDPVNHPMAPFYAIMLLIFIVLVLVSLVAIAMIRALNTLTDRVARERAQSLGVVYKPRPSFWSRFITAANAAVPVEDEKNIELDHNYDGIKELDNHLPPWWKYLFYATIVWGAGYVVVYHFSKSLPLMEEEYRTEVSSAEAAKRKFLASQPKVEIDENTLSYKSDAGIIAKGKEIYSINCSPCHKNDGGGGIGPNLTDEFWLHGGDVKNIYATIKNGVPEKGMVSWATVLSPEQLRDVSFFVMSLQGTNPPGAKAAQGELFKVEAPKAAADSLDVQAKL